MGETSLWPARVPAMLGWNDLAATENAMVPTVLLADIDNTLYDWPAFFAPSFRAMVHVLAREMERPEEELYEEFKTVFNRHSSLEYAFAIQELDSVRDSDPERTRRLIKIGRGAFNSVQRKRLQPYPGVRETLKWLRDQHVLVVGVTNSPVFRAQKRLYDLKLDSLLAGLVAWEGFKPSASDAANRGFVPDGRTRRRSRLTRLRTVPEDDCKPNERHYALALDAFGSTPDNAWAIGDSLSKDLEPAARLGVQTIWARYGAGFSPEDKDMETLLRITHWTEARIHTTYSKEDFRPDFVVDSFDELQKIIPKRVFTLFE